MNLPNGVWTWTARRFVPSFPRIFNGGCLPGAAERAASGKIGYTGARIEWEGALMRRSLLAVVLAVQVAALQAEPRDATAGVRPEPEFLIGLVTQQARRQCNGTPTPNWIYPFHEIGFVRVAGSRVDIRRYVGEVIVARGRVAPPPAGPPVVQLGPCTDEEMRSDWVVGPSGVRIRHQTEHPLPGFVVEKVTRLKGFGVERTEAGLRVRFRNPFSVPLDELAVVLHYEGCHARPYSASRRMTFTVVQPGQSVDAYFPERDILAAEPRGHRVYRGYSVQIGAPSDLVRFDLDVPLGALLEEPPQCPLDGKVPVR